MARFGVVFFVALTACYNPDWIDGQFKCQKDTDCPSSLVCVAGGCRRPDSGGTESQDLRGGGGDMRAPGDMTQTACTNGGQQLGNGSDVWACKGSFGSDGFGRLCTSAYHVCALYNSDDVAKLAAAGTTCPEGFYAVSGSVAVADGSSTELKCGELKPKDRKFIAGCGSETGVMPFSQEYRLCGGLVGQLLTRSAFFCGTNGSPWDCNNGLGDASHDTADRGGVLCCRD